MSEWIACADMLPGINAGLLEVKNVITDIYGKARFIYYPRGYYFCIDDSTYQCWEPTHWRVNHIPDARKLIETPS